MALLISVIASILFMTKWGIERARIKALIYFILRFLQEGICLQEMLLHLRQWQKRL